MTFIEVKVDINHNKIRQQVNEKLDKAIHEALFIWDVDQWPSAPVWERRS